jgi:hypothetical protein
MPRPSTPASKVEIYHFNPILLILAPLLALVL